MQLLHTLLPILLMIVPSMAQFFNFGNMFGGQQHHQEPQMMGSDSEWYQSNYEQGERISNVQHSEQHTDDLAARCDKYLCPHTLSCVHFPHHCPCAFPDVEDKVEFGEGSMMCASKGGFKKGESMRKIELARKGLL